ncbi:hypothetical protein GCM10008171_20120 [Methylopila jiangsuensis]|uniref:Uncharacterized protein n=1 Tax=Methylopila jiangsuensis TaxID=586230 RepID=A0A9W6JID1_9HYPH|nr:hypothetical protein GCM10008171_20120 [Methylopila jiangsuensis]
MERPLSPWFRPRRPCRQNAGRGGGENEMGKTHGALLEAGDMAAGRTRWRRPAGGAIHTKDCVPDGAPARHGV